jgi:ubiquinone/menaquinone biosynthesis C-methylase UbiE
MMTCVNWDAVAPDWGLQSVGIELMKTDLTAHLLAGLGDLAGSRLLELGSGTGALAERLADAAGPRGRVVASDVAPGMVALVRDRLARRDNTEVRELDATAIDQADAAFDAVVFRMGLMLVPDPDLSLQEIRRVLRAGGRAAIAVWGPPQDNPWLTALGMAAMMQGLVQGGPPVGPGTPFSLADADELEKRFRNAGFTDVEITSIRSTRRFADADEHFSMVSVLAPPLAAALRAAAPEQREAVRRTVAGLLEPYRNGDGLDVPVHAVAAIAS